MALVSLQINSQHQLVWPIVLKETYLLGVGHNLVCGEAALHDVQLQQSGDLLSITLDLRKGDQVLSENVGETSEYEVTFRLLRKGDQVLSKDGV